MSGRRKGLDPATRAAAMALARRADGGTPEAPPAPQVRRPVPSFTTIGHFQEMKTLHAAAAAMGLDNPYFRLHEGHASTTTVIDGAQCLNFASYDYLGLNADPRPAAAARAAIDQYGVSASASRMVAGTRPVHLALEDRIAAHYGAAAALTFVSGHATNVSTIGALLDKRDLVLSDRFIHNSVTVGTQLTEASRRSFPHNDFDALERLLAAERDDWNHVLVVVEGLYSMDGDMPDLRRLVELRARYGIWLMVDEAHALGCTGATGKGSFEEQGVDPAGVDIWMGTLSKTLASTGGFVAGNGDLIEYLRNFAPGYVFSVALPPALAASALTAFEVMEAEPWRAEKLRALSRHFLDRAAGLGLSTGEAGPWGVMPVVVRDGGLAVALSQRLLARGVNVAPVLFPGVPADAARLRFFLQASHETAQIDTALALLREELDAMEASGFADLARKVGTGLPGLDTPT